MRTPRTSTPGDIPGARNPLPRLVQLVALVTFAVSRLAIAPVASEKEYDEGIFLLSARSVAAGHELFSEVFCAQPPAFLESVALAFRLGGDDLALARLPFLGWALLALVAVGRIGRRLGGPWAAALATVALALFPAFSDLAHLVAAEMPALALALLALAAAFEARSRNWQRGWLVAAGALWAAAALFKFLVLPMLGPLLLVLLLEEDDDLGCPRRPASAVARRLAGRTACLAAGAGVVLLLPLLVYDVPALYDQTVSFQLAKNRAYAHHPWHNLQRAFDAVTAEPAIALVSAAGLLVVVLRRPALGLWLFLWLAATVAAVAVQAPLFWRHLVLLAPPLALAAGLAVPAALGGGVRPRATAGAATAVLGVWVAMAVAGDAERDHRRFPLLPGNARRDETSRVLERASGWLRSHTSEADVVVSDNPMAVYVAGRRSPPWLCDSAAARITTGYLTLGEIRSYGRHAAALALRKDGRLSRLRGFQDWADRNFVEQKVGGLGSRRSVWLRRSAPREDLSGQPSSAP